jgi:hypothetical protein
MAVCRSTIERNTPRRVRCRDDRTAHALDRLLGAVPPALLALPITEWIIVGNLPYCGLPAVPLPVARLAFAHRIPAVFMAPMIVAAAQREMLLNPDNLKWCSVTTGDLAVPRPALSAAGAGADRGDRRARGLAPRRSAAVCGAASHFSMSSSSGSKIGL